MKKLALALVALLQLVQAPAQAQLGDVGGLGWNKGGQSAASDLPYVTVSNQPGLSMERALSTHSSFPELVLNDTGANGSLELRWSGQLPIARGGSGAATRQAAINAFLNTAGGASGDIWYQDGSGNVTRLPKGTDGQNLQLSSGLPVWASGTGASNLPYLTIGNDAGLSAERAITAGTGLSATDGGANSTYTLSIDSTVTTLTGSQTLTNKTLTTPTLTTPQLAWAAGAGCTLKGGTNDCTLTWGNWGQSTSLSIPDPGTTSATQIVLNRGNQTINGTLTFATAPAISTISNTGTITLPAATTTLVGRDTTDTLTNKTVTALILSNASSITLKQSSGDYTVTWSNPAVGRAYTIPDVGGSANFAFSSGTLTAGSVAYLDGTKIQSTGAGTSGQYLKSQGSSAPVWASVSTFGGDGSSGATSLTTASVAGPKQYNATTFSTTAANTITYTGTGPIIVNCSSTFTNNGTMTLTGIGWTGGTGAAASHYTGQFGAGPNGGQTSHPVAYNLGGGGGGGGAAGGKSGQQSGINFGGAYGGAGVYSSLGGGGGGGGGGADGSAGVGGNGGNGGGTLLVCAVGAISNPSGGVINSLGAAATNATAASASGGGGGGGGNIWLVSQTSCDNSGTINVTGGAGGNKHTGGTGGGGGGGGNIYRWSPSNTGSGTFTLTGGAGGTGDNNGASGSNATATAITGTPNMPLLTWTLEHPEYLASIAQIHQKFAPGQELQLHQRALAREAARGDLTLYALYMSPDWEGTSTVCDAAEAWKEAA